MLGVVIFWWVKGPTSRQGGRDAAPQKQGVQALSAVKTGPHRDQSVLSAPRTALKKEQAHRTGTEPPPFAPASAIELVVLPKREDVQITVYNSADLTLVREERRLVLKRGWNWLQFMWANTHIDPTSLHLAPQAQVDQIRIEQLVYPAGLKDVGRWLIHSDVEGLVPFEMSYFASGVSWRAFYMGTLAQDEKTLSLQGYVRIENRSGEDFQDTQVRLLVGKVHLLDEILALSQRSQPFGSPVKQGLGDRLGEVRELLREDLHLQREDRYLAPKVIAKQGLSEYFLYTIPGTETIPHQRSKRLLSFAAHDVNVTSLYKYDESRYGGQPVRFVRFANDRAHNLGQTPIPGGNVKIYQSQINRSLSFVGSTDMKYIPINDEIELNLGPARLVAIKPKLMSFETANHRFDGDKNVAGWDELRTWRMDIDNARSGPVDCEILRDLGKSLWTIQVHDPGAVYEKHDALRVRFRLTVPPRSRQSLRYTVTTFNGTRAQEFDETAHAQSSDTNRVSQTQSSKRR